MGGEMDPKELLRPNDLLLHYDGLPEEERLDWLRHRMGSFDLAYAFDVCACDREFRGWMEWQWNGNVPFETFNALEDAGRLYVEEDPFVSHVPNADRAEFHQALVDWSRASLEPRLRLGLDPGVLLRGAVCGYAARTSGQGIVMRRDLLEASLEVGDLELLEMTRDPLLDAIGSVLEYLPKDSPIWRTGRSGDPQDIRRKGHEWWLAGTDHGTTIHRVAAVGEVDGASWPDEDDDTVGMSSSELARRREEMLKDRLRRPS